MAIDKPAVDAIFSPLTEAAEKRMFKINPTDKPKPISAKIIMKILITGGAGYIGSMLCTKLLQEGHSVTAVDLLKYDKDLSQFCFCMNRYPILK